MNQILQKRTNESRINELEKKLISMDKIIEYLVEQNKRKTTVINELIEISGILDKDITSIKLKDNNINLEAKIE